MSNLFRDKTQIRSIKKLQQAKMAALLIAVSAQRPARRRVLPILCQQQIIYTSCFPVSSCPERCGGAQRYGTEIPNQARRLALDLSDGAGGASRRTRLSRGLRSSKKQGRKCKTSVCVYGRREVNVERTSEQTRNIQICRKEREMTQ